MKRVFLITDASPLMTLAAAGQLDLLLLLTDNIIIPDVVLAEAANLKYRDGRAIDAWIKKNQARIQVPKTPAGQKRLLLLSEGQSARDLGEVAALEATIFQIAADPAGIAILLFEDKDVEKLAMRVADPRIQLVSTADFLKRLEESGAIRSAAEVLNAAASAGRNVTAQLQRLRAPEPS